MRLCFITFIFFSVISSMSSQVESELRNDFFAIYENNSFDNPFVSYLETAIVGLCNFSTVDTTW